LSVVYLIYNESFSAFEGQTLTREDLANEAIRLVRLLKTLLPCPEVDGLLALLLLHDSRRMTRSSPEKAFIPLEHQDRSLWNQNLIKEGVSLALSSLALGQPGAYQIQAAISSLHAVSPNWKTTDWQQIQQLYDVLILMEPSPVVALNRAMAIAYGGDLSTALEMLNELEEPLNNYQPFYVSRAELHSLTDNLKLAIGDYDRALELTRNEAERNYLDSKQVNLRKIKGTHT
jgi:RNA polymerase sigma-70 factor (ECF subfamily)